MVVCPSGFDFNQLNVRQPEPVIEENDGAQPGPVLALPDLDALNQDDDIIFDLHQDADNVNLVEAEEPVQNAVLVPPLSLTNPNESAGYTITGRPRNPPTMGE